MKIIEKFIQSKSGILEECEDKIFISDNFIAIVDGATSKTDFQYNNKTSGILASEIICDSLNNIPKNTSAYDVIDIISNKIYNFYKEKSLLNLMKKQPENRLSASIVIYSIHKREIWMVGDCQAMIDNKIISNSKKVDEILSNVRSLFIDIELQNGKTIESFQRNDSAREYIQPLLLSQSKLQNNHNSIYGYGAIDGYKIDKKEIKIYNVDTHSNHIILASDGYPILKDTLKASEIKLANILKKDPLLYNIYKSTKGLLNSNISYDDRSYIKFTTQYHRHHRLPCP